MDHGLESVFFAFQDKRNRDQVYARLLELGATSHLELNDLEDTTVKVLPLFLSSLPFFFPSHNFHSGNKG